jgi:hypothetical protein
MFNPPVGEQTPDPQWLAGRPHFAQMSVKFSSGFKEGDEAVDGQCPNPSVNSRLTTKTGCSTLRHWPDKRPDLPGFVKAY